MAFAPLTYRESLRDIEACLSAQATKLYHMGFREPVRRSTLADANESSRGGGERNRTAVRGFAGRRMLNRINLLVYFDTFFGTRPADALAGHAQRH